MFEIEEFVLGAVTVVRKHGAELQKKNNSKAHDYRATAAFHLFNTGKLLVELPDDSSPCSRVVNYLGDAYYLTRWCVVCRQGAALFFSAKLCGGVFAFHEFYLSPLVQALPLLFDSENAFEDVDSADSEMRRDVHDGKPESLHLLVGFDESGSVRCALGPSYLFEDLLSSSDPWGAQELTFAKVVQERPCPFGAGVAQFLLPAHDRSRHLRAAARRGAQSAAVCARRRSR